MLSNRLSYSQTLLRNLKRKIDDTIEQEENNNNKINNESSKGICSVKEISLPTKNIINSNELKTTSERKKVTPVLQQVTKYNIDDLRKVYISTFPLSYNSEFYNDIINTYPKGLSRVATYHNIVVGGICCRLEKKSLKDMRHNIPTTNQHLTLTQQINQLNSLKLLNTYSCYIMAIAVLEPYQNLSIGSKLISYIIKYCEKDKSISSINLHVHVKNENAIKFYKKFGFYQKDFIRNYYFNKDF